MTSTPEYGKVFISVNNSDKMDAIPIARDFIESGFKLVATHGTAKELKKNGINTTSIFKVGEGRPNIVDAIKNKDISLVINTPMGEQSRYDEEGIGKACIKHGILAITTLSGANAVIRAIRCKSSNKDVKSLQEYYS